MGTDKTQDVSIIIPVYNAEKYLNESIRSAIEQTYKNIEIILVVQTGQDNSLNICKKWEQKDSRIRIIIKEEKDRGLGPARNTGVQAAKGEYVCFLDADDTIDKTFVEKLYRAAKDADADIAECNYYREHLKTGKRDYVQCTYMMGREFNKRDKIMLGSSSVCNLLIKKRLVIDNSIWQPNLLAQDTAVYHTLIYSANKIAGVNEGLLFYKKFGGTNTLSSNIKSVTGRFESIVWMVEDFRRRGLAEKYENELKIYVRRWMSKSWSLAIIVMDLKDYKKSINLYKEYYDKEFNTHLNTEIAFGSFNLSRIINKLDFIEDPYTRINFSSIISIVSKGIKDIEISHKNQYRQIMLEREKNKNFFILLDECKADYFFFDLIEERHNIIDINGCYYTQSDAWVEMDSIPERGKIIYRKSDECGNLWKESCDKFFRYLSDYFTWDKIIMIENYLCETYSDGKVIDYYTQSDDIKEINEILGNYYTYIKENYPEIKIVQAYKAKNYCTDVNYEFGCFPWHINEWANIEIAQMIVDKEKRA